MAKKNCDCEKKIRSKHESSTCSDTKSKKDCGCKEKKYKKDCNKKKHKKRCKSHPEPKCPYLSSITTSSGCPCPQEFVSATPFTASCCNYLSGTPGTVQLAPCSCRCH